MNHRNTPLPTNPGDLPEITALLDALADWDRAHMPDHFVETVAGSSAAALRAQADEHVIAELAEHDRRAPDAGLEQRVFAASVGALRTHRPHGQHARRLSAPTRRTLLIRWSTRAAAVLLLALTAGLVFMRVGATPQGGGEVDFTTLTAAQLDEQLGQELEMLFAVFDREALASEDGIDDPEHDADHAEELWAELIGS